ncbi:hypothetical protein [Citrobacter freundii]|uniref:hypothetical protein n=1 Tax=Citrobacter freundii TaxID=546 RepID=UPI000B33BF68|nr:hypothetical protein [Citrobacter freundii]
MAASPKNHTYYKTLWGNRNDEITKISLTLFTIYDEIIFSPVDNPLPDFTSSISNNEYYNKDFGLRMPMNIDFLGESTYLSDDYFNWVMTDNAIKRFLSKVPDFAKRIIIQQAVCDIELSILHGAEVISSSGRRALMRRLCNLDSQFKNVEPMILEPSLLNSANVDFILPDFEINTIDFLNDIKNDKNTRLYGKSVAKLLRNKNGSIYDYAILAQESSLKNSRNESVNSYMQTLGKICSLFSLIPGVNCGFGVASVMLGETQKLTNLSNSNWIEFKPNLSKVKTRWDLAKLCEERTSQ